MKVSSNTEAARAAISGFAYVYVDPQGQKVSLGSSNIKSMRDGAKLSNNLLQDISDLVAGVKAEAERVTELASKVETRDQQDATSMGMRP